MKKLAIICAKGLDNFIDDIVKGLSDEYWVQRWAVTNEKEIKAAIDWANIVWLEWANEVAVIGSNYPGIMKKKVVLRLHGYESLRRDFLEGINWDNISSVIFVAKNVMETAIQNQPAISRLNVKLIPNGIDLKRYSYRDRKKGYRLGFLGHFNYKKNPVLMVQILKKLVDIDERYELFWAGSLQDERLWRYTNYILKDMGIEDHFTFDGWVEDTDEWLENVDIFLSTSVHEGYGVAIMEAMAKGIKPVIHNFYIAKEFYPKEWIFNTVDEAVEMITSDEYDSKGYRKFVERYSLEEQLRKIKEVIHELIKHNHKVVLDGITVIDGINLKFTDPKWIDAYEDNLEAVLNSGNFPLSYVDPAQLVYDKNVEYFIEFLDAVFNKKKSYKETKYYWFLRDVYERGLYKSPPEIIIDRFMKLYMDIKRDGKIRKPVVAFFSSEKRFPATIITHSGGKKGYYESPTQFFVASGRHRVAVASFLGMRRIPAFVLRNRFVDDRGNVYSLWLPAWKLYIEEAEENYEKAAASAYVGDFDGTYHNFLDPEKKRIVWEFVLSVRPRVLVDIGCNRGELSYGLKDYGIRVIGVDISPREKLGLPEDYEFIRLNIVEEDLNLRADVMLFLSVYHHIVYNYGIEKADETFYKLLKKTKYMVFDTGNPNETGIYRQAWVNALRKHFKSEKEIFDHFKVRYNVLGRWNTGHGFRTIVVFINDEADWFD